MRLNKPVLFLANANAKKSRAFYEGALGWSVSDIRQTVQSLRTAGVVFERYDGMNQDADNIWHAPSGAFVARFKNPDGHTLSLTQFK
jgi:predicted enzyme related to lactoylglutathione lyase